MNTNKSLETLEIPLNKLLLCSASHNAERFWPGGAAPECTNGLEYATPRRWAKNVMQSVFGPAVRRRSAQMGWNTQRRVGGLKT